MTLRISRIALREIVLPLVTPFRTAGGVVESRRILLLELFDSDNITTWSECVAESTPSYASETVDTCWLAISEWIAPLVLGTRFESVRHVHSLFQQTIRGHRMARAAVEMGIWAVEADKLEKPLASLLTSSSELPSDPRPFVETGIALGMSESPGALAERCIAAASEGYPRIKIKIERGRDIEYARAARDAAGDRAAISVDANCSYSLDDDDVQSLVALDQLGLSMIEQPLRYNDLLEHAKLQRRLSTPLCLDESITTLARAEEMLELNSARIINLKPGRVGGFAESIAIHDRCAEAGISLWCGGMLESGIGRAYNVALGSLPGFTLPGDLSPSSRYWERDIIREPWTMDKSGRVRVPLNRNGIGVDVDESFIDDLTVRRAELSAR